MINITGQISISSLVSGIFGLQPVLADHGLDHGLDRGLDRGPILSTIHYVMCDEKCPTKTFVVIKIRYLEGMAELSKFITLFITVD